jgi:hypothetical protein
MLDWVRNENEINVISRGIVFTSDFFIAIFSCLGYTGGAVNNECIRKVSKGIIMT